LVTQRLKGDTLQASRKRSTEHLSHFCQRSGDSGIYATRLSMVWQAAGRVLIQLTGSKASWSPAGGLGRANFFL
jgi:hypothetical protein